MMRNLILRFLRRQDGGPTVETVLWFPLIIVIFGLMVDTAMIFHGQAKILRVIQDGNRTLAVGRLADTEATQVFIEDALDDIHITATALTTISGGGVASTTVTVGVGQLQAIGFFSAFSALSINVTAEQMIENWET